MTHSQRRRKVGQLAKRIQEIRLWLDHTERRLYEWEANPTANTRWKVQQHVARLTRRTGALLALITWLDMEAE